MSATAGRCVSSSSHPAAASKKALRILSRPLVAVVFVGFLCFTRIVRVDAHNEDAVAASCRNDAGMTVEAAFRPGVITVDGDSKDWVDVGAHQFPLLNAISPESSPKYPIDPGSIQIKAVHDGRDLFFNLEIPGDYAYKPGQPTSCPGIAIMFAVGDDASYYNMGGCKQSAGNCTSTNCRGYEVDLMQFTISQAIPGRLYGSNILDNVKGTGADRFGNLNDMYGYSPHCVFTDGNDADGTMENTRAQNDWTGAWTHTSISLEYGLMKADSPYGTDGTKGFYIFELKRPLRTNDQNQQDAQLTIGSSHRFNVAVWYPVNGSPWIPPQHFSANCAWIPLKIVTAGKSSSLRSLRTVDILSMLSIFVALAALATTFVLGWWVKSNSPRGGGFQGIPNL